MMEITTPMATASLPLVKREAVTYRDQYAKSSALAYFMGAPRRVASAIEVYENLLLQTFTGQGCAEFDAGRLGPALSPNG